MHRAAPLFLVLIVCGSPFLPVAPATAQDWKPGGRICDVCAWGPPAPSTPASASSPLEPLLNASSFRGLKLELSRWEVAKVLGELGLTLRGATTVAEIMEICSGSAAVGRVHFTALDRVMKFEFSPQLFNPPDSNIRHFADDVFQRYQVHSDNGDDDVCFPGLTCFQGTSPTGERFLILKIAGDVQFQVFLEK